MNGANGEAGKSGQGLKGEELDGVLGRFEDWAKTRRTNPLANYGASAGIDTQAISVKARLAAEARDLSYEEALKASRFRRQPAVVPVESPPSPVASAIEVAEIPVEAAPVVVSVPVSAEQVSEAPVTAPAARPKAAAHSGSRRPPSSVAAAIAPEPETTAKVPQVIAAQLATVELVTSVVKEPLAATKTRRRQSPPSKKAPISTAARRAAAAPTRKLAPSGPVQRATPASTSAQSTVPAAAAVPAKAAEPRQIASRNAFEEIFKASIKPPAESTIMEVGKSSSFTMRLSEAEQAKIHTRAAQAKLSVSAYVRQCALGVDRGMREAHEHRSVSAYLRRCVSGMEDLQEQVELLTLREHPAPPPPGLSAIPGILGRFILRCAGGFRLRREKSPASITA